MNLDNAKDNGRRSGGEHLRKGSGVWRVIKKPKADCGVSGGDEKDRDGREKGCCNQLAEKGKVEYISPTRPTTIRAPALWICPNRFKIRQSAMVTYITYTVLMICRLGPVSAM